MGEYIGDVVTPQEMQAKAKLEWKVSKKPIYFKSDITGLAKQAKNSYLLVRSSDESDLGTCTDTYKPIQNDEIFEFFTKFAEAGNMQMETAGSLDSGRIVWGLAKLNSASFTIGNGDKTDMYLLMSSGHRVGFAYQMDLTSIRVVCMNTLRMARQKKATDGSRFRMTHSATWDDSKKREAELLVTNAMTATAAYELKAKQLLGQKVNRAINEVFVVELLQPNLLVKAIENSKISSILRDNPKNFMRTHGDVVLQEIMARESLVLDSDMFTLPVRRILDNIDKQPGNELSPNTMWNTFNGVTHYIDHQAGYKRDSGLKSAWYGTGANVKTDALELAVEYTSRLQR